MTTAKTGKKAKGKSEFDRYAGLTQEQIRALLEIEIDALDVSPEDGQRGPLDHTVSTIAARLQHIGINCNDAWRERFAASVLAWDEYYSIAPAYRWYESMKNPKESKTFRELCIRQCDMDTAKEHFGRLTDAEYCRIGRLILRRRCVHHDDLVEAFRVFVLASYQDGVEKVLQRAIRNGDSRYITKYAHRTVNKSEKVALAFVMIRDAHYAEDLQRVVAYIRRERIVNRVRSAFCDHVICPKQRVTFEQLKGWFVAVGRPLTRSYVEKYIVRQRHVQPPMDALKAIDWLLAHGASKSWVRKRDALRRTMHKDALRGVNPQWADHTAKLAKQPLTTKDFLTFAVRCHQFSDAPRLRRYALDRATAQIVSAVGAPKTKPAKSVAS